MWQNPYVGDVFGVLMRNGYVQNQYPTSKIGHQHLNGLG